MLKNTVLTNMFIMFVIMQGYIQKGKLYYMVKTEQLHPVMWKFMF